MWLQENCPDVPIPHMYGFGLSTGKTVCSFYPYPSFFHLVRGISLINLVHFSWQSSVHHMVYPISTASTIEMVWIRTSNLLCSTPKATSQWALATFLIEYIDQSRGTALFNSWEQGRHDTKRWTNLFHGLSRIMLSLSRTLLPKKKKKKRVLCTRWKGLLELEQQTTFSPASISRKPRNPSRFPTTCHLPIRWILHQWYLFIPRGSSPPPA